MRIAEAVDIIEKLAPRSISEEYCKTFGHYDNTGFLIGERARPLTGVYITMDVLLSDVESAKTLGCNLILSHHPVIYNGITSVNTDDFKGRVLERAISYGIAIYSSHLSLDMTKNGIDDTVAKTLGIKTDSIYERLGKSGYGKCGKIAPCTLADFRARLEKTYSGVRVFGSADKKLFRAASFCGGGLSGSRELDFCEEAGADVVVSCDVQNHVIVEATERGIAVVSLIHGEEEFLAMKEIFGSVEFGVKKVFSEINIYRQ